MNRLFTSLYDLLHRRRALLWTLLALSTLVMGWFAARLSFAEDITSFLPDDSQGRRTASIFRSLRIKDKIVIMLTADDPTSDDAPQRMVEAADAIARGLRSAVDDGLLESITDCIDEGVLDSATELIYNHLPALMDDRTLARLDSLTSAEAIDHAVARAYGRLTSPAGIALGEFVLRDPLDWGTQLMAGFQCFDTSLGYELYDDHIFTPGLETLLLFAVPAGGSSATADNERLVTLLEEQLEAASERFEVRADYFGAVGVAVYNARQIKRDTMGTLTVALLLIVTVITLVFRNRWAVPLMMVPVLYGALFALGAVYLIQGSISSIAVGAGAAVMGIALSYSIHMLAHSNHTDDPRRVVSELAYPLTVGSFTTIGAFFGLVFTRSQLLHDFGLFSALTLVGTTLFCLVFLPHMLSGGPVRRPGWLLERIERVNAYRYDSNRWLAGALIAATLVGLFFFGDVRFESDIREGDYTFQSYYTYIWPDSTIHTRWRSRKNPFSEKQMALTVESMDPIALFFNLRSAQAENFRVGEPATLQMVLQDTIRHLHYRYLGRENKKIRNMGRFRTLKFECQLGTTEGYSFTDGTIFTIWISDDDNKIPLYIESPVKIGSINAYISGYKGLKYPVSSLMK